MIKLPRKPAKLGTNINGRTEKHGDERVPKMDIKLTTLLTEKQTIALTGESHVVAAWFKTEGGKYADPLLKGFAPYRKEGKYKDSLCVLTVGVNAKKIDLGDVTIKSLVFKPIDKGATQLACTIQASATMKTLEAFLWMDQEVDAQLEFGEVEDDEDESQERLPLESKGDDEDEDDDDDKDE